MEYFDKATQRIRDRLFESYDRIMVLKLYVDLNDNDLNEKYREAANIHNNKLYDNPHHIDAGFDLFCPENKNFVSNKVNKLDHQVICSAKIIDHNNNAYYTGYYMYPRSSISKTNLRLANNVGIIDAGYRGHLIGMFDVINANTTPINRFDRYLQICAPGLIPILVEMVGSVEELGEKTIRGDGGFGSTGH